jgi:hypothetical protein|tara:strand:+ start:2512 stop:2733 length:222 start_codon:yes stop_codon:yes gene_type:complete
MRKKIALTVSFVTFVDVPDDATREQIVKKAKEEIHICDTKGQGGFNPVIRRGEMKINRVSSMQPTEDLFGNIN